MKDSTLGIVWAVVALFLGTMAAVVLLTVLAGADNTAALVASLLGSLSAIVAVLVNLVRTNAVATDVAQVRQDTHDLTNGLLDSKVRAGVADVLPDHMVDPAARGQLTEDRRRRREAATDDEGWPES